MDKINHKFRIDFNINDEHKVEFVWAYSEYEAVSKSLDQLKVKIKEPYYIKETKITKILSI